MTVRAGVVSLLLDLDMDACNWPRGDHPIHLDGRRFTDEDAGLLNSATKEEIASASDAMMLMHDVEADELADLDRLYELVTKPELTPDETAEAEALAERRAVNLANEPGDQP